ncbi:serine--tRNA ligase [Chelativorans salis]|uniref:Serine--tRNA ligase n=1 Tax=Chelativorans salis TaxID=2978478 RepID=A0ABT2LL68_9HYPH|nr:serine--tRNA ligase [Chelativorans sp. EGI FJ00035]MCT7375337.1 serine--tRNA ligase [Chelativorans sp. EGI FJ00035]
MLDIKWIRENPEDLVLALKKRGQAEAEARSTVESVIAADEARRTHLTKLQEAQERRNAASKEIGKAMGAGDQALAEKLKAEVAELKGFVQSGEAKERELDADLRDQLARIPNVPLDDVPEGADEKDNVEVRRAGEPKRANSWKEHFELGEALGMMDFERAAKLSGSRFTVVSGQLARLERALGQFMLDLHTTEHGYTEVQPPLLVRDDALFGTGQLPKFEEDLFFTDPRTPEWSERLRRTLLSTGQVTIGKINDAVSPQRMREIADVVARNAADMFLIDDYFATIDPALRLSKRLGLIPTAEVPLTNLVREEILDANTLPLRYTALTPCFRSEAGSAGKDTRGMLRQHQFYKVEMVSITDAESSLQEHERMTECAETVLKKLGLPFRTVVLCTGDMGFGARKTYDIEVWLPGQNAYREISSCSVCGDFQARRMNTRYRSGEKQTRFVHTLNGSGVATGRALIAVMENYQNEDGSISIPEILQPYMGGTTRIEAAKG